jgi:hypothetical protein
MKRCPLRADHIPQRGIGGPIFMLAILAEDGLWSAPTEAPMQRGDAKRS